MYGASIIPESMNKLVLPNYILPLAIFLRLTSAVYLAIAVNTMVLIVFTGAAADRLYSAVFPSALLLICAGLLRFWITGQLIYRRCTLTMFLAIYFVSLGLGWPVTFGTLLGIALNNIGTLIAPLVFIRVLRKWLPVHSYSLSDEDTLSIFADNRRIFWRNNLLILFGFLILLLLINVDIAVRL
jgi:hypothetical protein